jgi:hypothetical protein
MATESNQVDSVRAAFIVHLFEQAAPETTVAQIRAQVEEAMLDVALVDEITRRAKEE